MGSNCEMYLYNTFLPVQSRDHQSAGPGDSGDVDCIACVKHSSRVDVGRDHQRCEACQLLDWTQDPFLEEGFRRAIASGVGHPLA